MTTKLPKLPDTHLTRAVQAYAREAVAAMDWVNHPETVAAKKQWDAVADYLGADGDNPDAVLEAARRAGKAVAVADALRPAGDNAEHLWVLEMLRDRHDAFGSGPANDADIAALTAAIAALSQPSVAVTELTERQRKVVEFALSRFIREAYWRASEAAQKSTAVYFASDALERLLNDAKDAEQALAALSQGGKP